MRARALVLLALAVALPARLDAAEGEVRARLEVTPREATVGDRIEAKLLVEAPPGSTVARPDPGPSLGPFAVLASGFEGPAEAAGGARWTWTATLAAFETGALEIPAVEVRIAAPGGERLVASEPVTVTIRSVVAEKEAADADAQPEIADLKPPASIPPDYGPLLRAALILALLLAVSAGAWWLHRRLSPRFAAAAVPADPFHRMPPHVWAYAELKRLVERRFESPDDAGPFFSELSRIVKTYLGGRYRVPLLECTTEEVPGRLEEAGAPGSAARGTRSLLERCDRVKFAKEVPDPAACRAAVEEAYRLVDATRPAEVEAPAVAEGAA